MAAPIEIAVWQGEIAELEVDALIIGANESLFMTAGPAAAVRRYAGEEVERAAVAQGPIAAGSAVVTSGGNMAAAFVIHAVAVGHAHRADPDTLRAALRAALAFAEPLQLRRIAVSCLGTERGAFMPDEAASILVEELSHRSGSLPESAVIATAGASETAAVGAVLERARIAG
ncbi:MAG: macro domain-containing protein [Candidatus Limnocylindria bacterium]